ncbi:hypothetical protein NBRGN_067_00270 [Nocardia brasiliensis NBRC 14402]|uniref:hypothetical protein n=1 Tax=Nocardia brasiliensis TaxID=37326 RepID=UPI00045C83E9|nr:hypothetical protein [Nocardia brasiliensis]GAJ83938.1 hypothetical protein NBRGN_067_00270 [Nocardia brasiliensis NBRC 14402]SUB40249.1 Uncharacterised protein [Nocardia brasiliensis]
METLIVVGVVVLVLAVVVAVVQIASRPPSDGNRWERDDPDEYEAEWDDRPEGYAEDDDYDDYRRD